MSNDTTPLLWSDERIQEWWRQVFQPDISPHIQREGALHLMEKIRNDYEIKIADLEKEKAKSVLWTPERISALSNALTDIREGVVSFSSDKYEPILEKLLDEARGG